MTTTKTREQVRQEHIKVLAEAAAVAVARRRFPRKGLGRRVDESWQYRDRVEVE